MPEQRDAAGRPRLELRPFRATRFNPAIVADLAEVTSPPYDVMDRAMIAELLAQHPHNVVRLILPRLVNEPLEADNPYVAAARRLDRWLSRGLLVTDRLPALYVYEYGDDIDRVCGVVGALDLHDVGDRVVLPHEDVMPAIVADRLAMMEASQANLEPILLVYDGYGAAGDIIHEIRRSPPDIDVRARDRTMHRMWTVTGARLVERLRAALAPHQALIADGHHRYATYLQLRARQRAAGHRAGPWDRGLALLIDHMQFPLRLRAIHRSIAELDLTALPPPEGTRLGPPRRLETTLPAPPTRSGRLLLTDGKASRLLELPTGDARLGTDTEALHERLLPAWSVTDDRVGYHHTVRQAVHRALQDAGVAALMHPAEVAEVMAAAREGRILPRKSTSFGPKPRTGLLMRRFADET